LRRDAIPLAGYPICGSFDDGREIILGIREHVALADHGTRGPLFEARIRG
jgi:hypothetical protein